MLKRNTIRYAFSPDESRLIKNKMLNWLRSFSIFSYLDNNDYRHTPCRYEMLAAAHALETTASFPSKGDWWFGHLAYDLKNEIEPKLRSRHADKVGFSDRLFYRPETVAGIASGAPGVLFIETYRPDPEAVLQEILSMPGIIDANAAPVTPQWQYRFRQEEYQSTVAHIRRHIEEGDCYEMNLCVEAFAEGIAIDPLFYFNRLNTLNPSPFAALYHNNDQWLLCASPERFLYREKDSVLSQPIKGTARRSKDAVQDLLLKQQLRNDKKEMAENVMIVDLVRNDLARSAQPGTVSVPELFGVYTFPQVHQLISTVTATLLPGIDNATVIRNAFPMGSMTGAPKVMVMELIERYERSRRGLYSGSTGYCDPQGNFDFNVVIRSLLYDAASGYLSYQTGGAITYESNAASEWEEVRLKANAMEQIFL